jgi:hypothetical protein
MSGLGRMHARSFSTDAKHLAFVLARYHFVARMLTGKDRVLEVGCGDCTGANIVKQTVAHWSGIDIDPTTPAQIWDILKKPYGEGWDAIYALDVLEHIAVPDEDAFFGNINRGLIDHGVVIIGSPSLESQPWASALSLQHHVNCKTEDNLRATLQKYYRNVFLFGMNDTTLHVGFGPMCHYRLAICTGKESHA